YVLVHRRVHNGVVRRLVGRGGVPLYRQGGVAPGHQDVLGGKVKGRYLIVRGTALQLVVAEGHLQRAVVGRDRVHDKGKGNDVITALRPVGVRRDAAAGVAHYQYIDVLRVGRVGIGARVADGRRIVRRDQGKVPGQLCVGKVLIIIKVEACRVERAKYLCRYFRQVKERKAIGHGIVALAQGLRLGGNRGGVDLQGK